MDFKHDGNKPNVFKDEEQTKNRPTHLQDPNNKKTSTGLEQNIAGLLCYLFGFITGLIFLLVEKENRFVRFHAMQSIVLSVSIIVVSFVLGFIPVIGWLLSLLLAPVSFILWIFLMYKAYSGEWYKLPVIGDFAKQQID